MGKRSNHKNKQQREARSPKSLDCVERLAQYTVNKAKVKSLMDVLVMDYDTALGAGRGTLYVSATRRLRRDFEDWQGPAFWSIESPENKFPMAGHYLEFREAADAFLEKFAHKTTVAVPDIETLPDVLPYEALIENFLLSLDDTRSDTSRRADFWSLLESIEDAYKNDLPGKQVFKIDDKDIYWFDTGEAVRAIRDFRAHQATA